MAIKTVDVTGNKKLGIMAATYRTVGETCPSSCPLLAQGCYAKGGPVGIHQRKATHSEEDGNALVEWFKRIPLNLVRHHVSGDMFYGDEPDWTYIKGMNRAHTLNPRVIGYTYTHGWRKLNPHGFADNLTVNASCDTWQDVADALAAGWVATIVVPATEERKRFNQDGMDVVVCPNQTVGLTCNQCGLCFNGSRKFVVAFKAHGASKNIVSKRVAQ